MKKYNKIKQQKLILKPNKDTSVIFMDEQLDNHESLMKGGDFIDVYLLVISCFEPISDEGSVLTCSCGFPECAGFWNFSSEITDTEIIWNVNNGKDLLKFDKTQYQNEVKACLEKLKIFSKEINENKYTSEDNFFNPLSIKEIKMYQKIFNNDSPNYGREKPRHKIIINPGNDFIYTTEDKKKIFFKANNLDFHDTDIFGQELLTSLDASFMRKWYKEFFDKTTNWEKWNKRGIKIAKRIRDSLSDAFDILYQFQNVENNELVHIKKIKDED